MLDVVAPQPAFAPGPLGLKDILDHLVADGLITAKDSENTLARCRWRGQRELHPLVLVANQKLSSAQSPDTVLSLERLTQWLAKKADLPYLRIDPLKLDMSSVCNLVSQSYARRYKILPVAVDSSSVTFATTEPFVTEWLKDLGTLLRKDIARVVINPLDLDRYIMEFHSLARSVQGAQEGDRPDGINNFEQLWELGEGSDLGAEDQPIVQLCDWLFQYAFEQRASDIHLEPRRDEGSIRFRIDGVMHKVYRMPPTVMRALTSRVKILSRLDVAEKRRPQDGRIKTRSPSGREVELRVATMATAFGEKCVARIFDPDVVVKSFDQLGFSADEELLWRQLIDRPNGIVLVTGPTGSGKTTTLYATLQALARPEVNICTVEDPIELVNPALNQTQVQPAIDLGFAQGLRALLRQDPDIIMVGEIRDLETAQMAIQASLTGHLVLSTLHTNDAPSAVSRLMDLGLPHYLLQATLAGVMAQRLVRTLCPHCKGVGTVDPALWETLIHPYRRPTPSRVAIARGCPECRDTGYRGRVALYEILALNGSLKSALNEHPDTNRLRQLAVREGMQPLRVSAINQVLNGVTTVEEVLKIIPPHDEEE